MKLFGLLESVSVKSIFITILDKPIPVQHPELFRHLDHYSKDLSVGLELINGDGEFNFPQLKFIEPQIHMNLLDYFRSQGNQIYFLEQKEYFKQMVSLTEQLTELERKVRRLRNPQRRDAVELQIDRLRIEFGYMNIVGREQPIFDSIIKYKPDLVFLGDAHAARLYNNRDEFREEGVDIEGYWHDSIVKSITIDDLMFAASASSEHMPMEAYLEDSVKVELVKVEEPIVPECALSIEAEKLYKAVKEGRVTDYAPNFIGTWNTRLPHRGLFEVFINKIEPAKETTKIKGTIEDCLGLAEFSGQLQDNLIGIVKKYTHATDEAAKGEIIYDGKYNEKSGEYEGIYTINSSENYPFTMRLVNPFK